MKQILFVPVFLFLGFSGFSQDIEIATESSGRTLEMKSLRFGAYFAPNKSTDGLYRVRSGGSKVGFTWGLMADYFFAENYCISSGFQINTTGGNLEVNRIASDTLPNTVTDASFNYSLQYLELPFQLKLLSDPILDSRLKIFGQIGLSAGINIGKKATYDVLYTNAQGVFQKISEEKEKLRGSTSIAPVTLQLNIGAGIQRPLTEKLSFYFGLFFNNGFAPDATNPKEYDLRYSGSFSDGNIRLNSFVFRFGILF
jgi:hypothetical protein